MSLLLEGSGITVQFGGFHALRNASLQVARGTIHALIGPNGAGKSTMMNVVSGITPASQGSIRFEGIDCTRLAPHQLHARGISRNFQQVRLIRELSVLDNVALGHRGASASRWWKDLASIFRTRQAEHDARETAQQMLAFVGLAGRASSSPEALTLVEQRRCEIARALAGDPQLLLLDEPAAGMNPAEVDELGTLLRRVVADGRTVLLVEHHMRLVMTVSHTITVLAAGSVITSGSVQAVRSHPEVISAYLGSGE